MRDNRKILIPEGTEGVQVNSLIAVLVEEDEQDADLDAFFTKFSVPLKTGQKIVEEKKR